MEKDWVKIYTSNDILKVSMVSTVLKDHHIEVVQLSKKDSLYLSSGGEVELYIHPVYFNQAIEIIIQNEL